MNEPKRASLTVSCCLFVLCFAGGYVVAQNCDNECRERRTFQYRFAGVGICMDLQFKDCFMCWGFTNRCWKYDLLPGLCTEDTTVNQFMQNPGCSLLCPLNALNGSGAEAIFTTPDENGYVQLDRGVYKCKGGSS